MNTTRYVLLMITGLLILHFQCAKKKRAERVFLLLGDDSITSAVAAEYDPTGSSDSARMVNTGTRSLIAQTLSDENADTLLEIFNDRLSLVSGAEWTSRAASRLLKAAMIIAGKTDTENGCTEIRTMSDSLMNVIENATKEGFSFTHSSIGELCDSTFPAREQQLHVLEAVLGVNTETAKLCHDFVFKTAEFDTGVSEQNAKSMVSGLLSGKKAPVESENKGRKSSVEKVRQVPDAPGVNSKKVLTLRKKESIRDTITRHIPELRQLYKQLLKKDASVSGVVVVTFTVAPDGSVVSAGVKKTSIAQETFLKNLRDYLKKVQFQPVPENAGTMRFDFPFEFNPEM